MTELMAQLLGITAAASAFVLMYPGLKDVLSPETEEVPLEPPFGSDLEELGWLTERERAGTITDAQLLRFFNLRVRLYGRPP